MGYRLVVVDSCDQRIQRNRFLRTVAAFGYLCSLVGMFALGLSVVLGAVGVLGYVVARALGYA